MKYLVKFVVVTFLLIISTHAFAEQKIVVMDMKLVLNNSKAGKGAQDFLKKSFNDNQKKFADIEKNLKKEEDDLLQKKTVLSKEEYTKKADSLRKKVIDYQSQRRSAMDKIATQRAEAREILMKKVEPIVDNYIRENNIALVMDKQNMIGGLSEYDITSIIIEKLNKELPSINLK
tara:strand:+ start:1133 stop:1657 length:525 start_codon:yes stop_codon:yes gene_type:complete